MRTIADMIAGKRGVEGLQQLLSPVHIRPVLQRMLHQAGRLEGCHLRRAKFKPGRKVTAYYDLEIGDSSQQPHSSALRPIAVTWFLPGTPPTLCTEEGTLGVEIERRGLANPFQQLIHAQPDATMHIQVAPFDPHYPQLTRLSDPTYVGELLRAYTTEECHWTVTPIRYRPRQRHVLRYDSYPDGEDIGGEGAASADRGQKTLFAKLYADTKQAASSQRDTVLISQLADWLASTTADTLILRPLADLAADNTVLYAQVPGEPLSAKLGAPSAAANRAILKQLWQTGVALRRLHDAPAHLASTLPAHTITQEVKAITRTCEHIDVLLPETGQLIRSLLARASDHYAGLPQEAPTFVHGDFKADHVLAANDRLTLIDFDSCALADPALDIGKFLADLAWWCGGVRRSVLAQMSDAFLTGYGLVATDPRLQRARLWQALIAIKIIAHRVQIFDEQWATRSATSVRRVQESFG